jgi:putative transposase
MYYYKCKEKDDSELIILLQTFSSKHPTLGFWKLYGMIRKKGYICNHKRVRRVYRALKLNIRRRVIKRRLPSRVKVPLLVPEAINQVWSIDFMSDALWSGKSFRTFNVIDDYNREALAVEIDTSFPAYKVVEILKELIRDRGKPKQIRTDNGPEFISSTFFNFCNQRDIEVKYIQPGKPMQNGFIERFNGSFRREVLDAYIFYNLKQLKKIKNEWLTHYNNERPHDAFNGLAPLEYYDLFNKSA